MQTDLQPYRAFVAVVEQGTIAGAARLLGLPRPTVSRQLARLESELAVVLLHRTTRKVTPSRAGERLYDQLVPLLQRFTDLEADVRRDATVVSGLVRVSVIPLVAPLLAPVVGSLQAAHPHLTVEVVSNVRLVDLRTEGFDAAIWAGDPRDPELITRTLTAGRVGLVATPTYLTTCGEPRRAEDLAEHRLLRGHSASSRPRVYWPLVDGGRVRVDGPFVSNSPALLRAAALDHQGICLLSDLNAADAIADGRLRRVLPEVVGTTVALRLLTAQRSPMPARLRVLVDALVSGFPAVP